MEITVSIIIPVYKYLDYLERCLDSLVAQKFKDFEVILVCHQDYYERIDEIVQQYTLNLKLIKVEGRDNVSICRNVGISEAKGKYIAFIDSDDYVSEEYLEVLVDEMKDDTYIAMCNYSHTYGNDIITKKYSIKNRVLTAEDLLGRMFGGFVIQYNGYLWNKLFVTKVIRDNNITFDERISLNEDRLFIVCYLLKLEKTSKIVYNSKSLYNYYQHDDSITSRLRKRELSSEKAVSEIIAFSECEERLKDYKWIREYAARESIEKTIRLLRVLQRNTKESKYLSSYLKQMRKKYGYLFSKRRNLQIFIYEHFFLRKLLLNLRH